MLHPTIAVRECTVNLVRQVHLLIGLTAHMTPFCAPSSFMKSEYLRLRPDVCLILFIDLLL